jgi:hypothetical protein
MQREKAEIMVEQAMVSGQSHQPNPLGRGLTQRHGDIAEAMKLFFSAAPHGELWKRSQSDVGRALFHQ